MLSNLLMSLGFGALVAVFFVYQLDFSLRANGICMAPKTRLMLFILIVAAFTMVPLQTPPLDASVPRMP